MEAVSSVLDKIKGVSRHFLDGLPLPRRRNPIEILKRLQREAFSDLMKLRDRQDKVEKILSFQKVSKGMQESGTRVRGEIDVLAGMIMTGDVEQQHYDILGRGGIRPGIDSWFTFETTVGENDTLVAEFKASQKGEGHNGDFSGAALSLAKVSYTANMFDWFSASVIPIGAQIKDFGNSSYSSYQRMGITDLSSVGPPLLNQQVGTAFGVTVRKSNIVAFVGQSISGPGAQTLVDGIGHAFSTFGQVVCKLPRGIEFALLGRRQVAKKVGHHLKFGSFTLPVGFLKHATAPETSSIELIDPSAGTSAVETFSTGSIALKVESNLNLDTKIAGWLEMTTSNPKNVQWALNFFNDSEYENGWGLNLSGMADGATRSSRLQAESYLKLNLAKKFSLKPGIVYAVDGNTRILSLMVRSNWSF